MTIKKYITGVCYSVRSYMAYSCPPLARARTSWPRPGWLTSGLVLSWGAHMTGPHGKGPTWLAFTYSYLKYEAKVSGATRSPLEHRRLGAEMTGGVGEGRRWEGADMTGIPTDHGDGVYRTRPPRKPAARGSRSTVRIALAGGGCLTRQQATRGGPYIIYNISVGSVTYGQLTQHTD